MSDFFPKLFEGLHFAWDVMGIALLLTGALCGLVVAATVVRDWIFDQVVDAQFRRDTKRASDPQEGKS